VPREKRLLCPAHFLLLTARQVPRHRCESVSPPSILVCEIQNPTRDRRTALLIPPPRVFGACRLSGFLLQWWAKSFDLMPDWAARHILAHELGHVILKASPDHRNDLDESAEERQVEDLISLLGFGEARDFHRWAGPIVSSGCLTNKPETTAKPTSTPLVALEERPASIHTITRPAKAFASGCPDAR
jgi:hypothetical protein